jgi:hypothetical protein
VSSTRRALFAGAALALPAVAASATTAPCAAAEAYRAYSAISDAHYSRRGRTDEEVGAFIDAIDPLCKAISDAPCDSKAAALAKLRLLDDEGVDLYERAGEVVAQVLRWLETV